MSSHGPIRDGLRLFAQFIRRPGAIGAVVPSSAQLADRITAVGDVAHARVVVELGPGTGVITSAIQRTLQPGATFFAIEANAAFVEAMKVRHPDVTVHHDSAVAIRVWLEAHGHHSCDCIVSGLPFAAFPGPLQDEILAAIDDVLAPGGRLVTFAYLGGLCLPGGRRFRRRLRAEFANVSTTSTVWRNVPPAFVYRALKPLAASPSEPALPVEDCATRIG